MFAVLRRNLAWAILAIALSVALWGVITTQQNPDVLDVFQAVPVEVRNLPADLTVRNDLRPVRVTVSAPRDVWQELRPAKFLATIDLARVGPGLQEVPVVVQTIDARARVEDVTPAKTLVHLEPIRRKDVTTRIRIVGELPPGYRAGPPKLTPETIMVTGPQSLVEQTASAIVDVDLIGVTTSVSQVYKAQVVDSRSERIERVTLGAENVLVEIRVEQERSFKIVPIAPRLAGTIAPGYQVAGLRIDPATTTIEGDARTVEGVDALQTAVVDLTDVARDVSATVAILPPDGIRLTRPQPVVVQISVAPIESTIALDVAPTVAGLPTRLRATIIQATVRVSVTGPMPILAGLTPASVPVTVNVAGLEPGLHQVRPAAQVMSALGVSQIAPDRVDVRISLIPPTPTAVVEDTPTPEAFTPAPPRPRP